MSEETTPLYAGTPIGELTDKQIAEVLKERKKERLNKEREDRIKYHKVLLAGLPELLPLLTHERTSCAHPGTDNSGFHPSHGGCYCTKCFLEDCMVNEDIPDDVEITLTVTATKRSDR